MHSSVCICLALAALIGACHGSFLLLVPQEFRAGQPLHVTSTVHKSSGRVNVEVSLIITKDNVLATARATVSMGETKIISLDVPNVINPTANYAVQVVCTGGLDYNNQRSINFNANTTVVLVQTDKTIYKPEQLVRIRLATIDDMLRPVKKNLVVTIIDPHDNKIERITNMTQFIGVAETEFQLSKYPTLGQWTILVEDGTDLSYSHNFQVDEYVLPKFSVELKSDKALWVKTAQDTPIIEVKAMYTYGEGVQGKCELTASVEGTASRGQKYIMELSREGTATFSDIDWALLGRMARVFPAQVVLRANVTDVTGRTELEETGVTMLLNNIKLEILDTSTLVVRNGIPARVNVLLSDISGAPLPEAEVEVKVKLPNIFTEMIQLKETTVSGQKEINFEYTPSFKQDAGDRTKGTIEVSVINLPNVTTSKTVWTYYSHTNNAIQLVFNAVESDASTLKYNILSDFNERETTTFSYTLVSKGNIVSSGRPIGNTIELPLRADMCPEAKLLVYMVVGSTSEPEVLADMALIKPQLCFLKQVEVGFPVAEARVGSELDMSMSVERSDGQSPGVHQVFYLGVDKSVILLQGSRDLGEPEVKSSLMENSRTPFLSRSRTSDWRPHSSAEIILAAGLEPLQKNMRIRNWEDRRWATVLANEREWQFDGGDVWMAEAGMVADHDAHAGLNQAAKEEAMDDVQERPPATQAVVRKNFPDTWLWSNAVTDENGKATQSVTLPDTITTWVVSAFAINEDGMAVTKEATEVTGFQTFFLTMNLPYSIKRGEVFTLRVTVFNYRDQQLQTVVSLQAQPQQFSVLEETPTNGYYLKDLTLTPKLAGSVEYKIQATTIGKIELNVKAEDNVDGQSDHVMKKLIVTPEGVERSRAISKVLDSPGPNFFDISWPKDFVPDSRRVEVKATGDIFGQALNNLDSLVRQPYGCGEQNMITTVPNIMGVSYIEETEQSNMEDLKTKLLANAKLGYQRELNYRHKDGSFSAWGEKGSRFHSSTTQKRGSTWLTAFVIKSFSLASKFLKAVEMDVLSEGIIYLKEAQNSDGQFVEYGQVLHSEMTSGTTKGPSLTVYCLISMLETARALGNDVYGLEASIQKATSYIINTVTPSFVRNNQGKFLASMTVYALSLLPNPDARAIKARDDLLETVLEMGVPWQHGGSDSADSAKKSADHSLYYKYNNQNLEVAAYTLLAYINIDRLADATPIMQWLQTQQNSKGGYSDTQKTVMVLQALSKYGALVKNGSPTALLTIKDPVSGNTTQLDLSGENAVLLQTYYLSSPVDQVEISLEGTGAMAVVKVVYVYYTEAGQDDQALPTQTYTVRTSSQKTSANTHHVRTCVRSLASQTDPGMTVTTLTLPSGERCSEDVRTMMKNNPLAARVELEENLVHFYTSEPPRSESCFVANVEREVKFEVQKPGSARVYSYYSPENMQEVALDLNQACVENCDTDAAVALHVANLLLTLLISALVSLLACC